MRRRKEGEEKKKQERERRRRNERRTFSTFGLQILIKARITNKPDIQHKSGKRIMRIVSRLQQ